MNLLSLSEAPDTCIELRSSSPMTVWMGNWHLTTQGMNSRQELVFEPFETDSNFVCVVDSDLNAYGLGPDGWKHIRLFNVAINVDRFLAFSNRTQRDGVARILPFHMCVQSGLLKSLGAKSEARTPQDVKTRQLPTSTQHMLIRQANLLKSLHDQHEWQMLVPMRSSTTAPIKCASEDARDLATSH